MVVALTKAYPNLSLSVSQYQADLNWLKCLINSWTLTVLVFDNSFGIYYCTKHHLKVFTNEKRGGLRVISFNRPPFKLLSRNFQKNLCRPHPVRGIKPLSEHLFLLFANNYWFPITLLCLAATHFSHRKLNWNIGIVHHPRYLRSR